MHSVKRKAKYSRKFSFEIQCHLPEIISKPDNKEIPCCYYSLIIDNLDKSPVISEELEINGKKIYIREGDKIKAFSKNEHPVPMHLSLLLFVANEPLFYLLKNVALYRIDPLGAKEPDRSDTDPSVLDSKGHNLASVLSHLLKSSDNKEAINEWMEIIVPGLEKIATERQNLDGKTAILFKEQNTRKRFPAHLISDGTVYALSLLVALFSAPKYGFTLIEEPERGIHPAAIRELVEMMRELATWQKPIWITTHSESVVRFSQVEELVLVGKEEGRTKMISALSSGLTQENLHPLELDEAWLSNLFGAGLP